MKITCRQTDLGVEFAVKASPGSRKNEIRGVVDGALKISVTAVAEKGKANAAIIKLLAKELGVAKSQIELVSGATGSRKKFLVQRVPLNALEKQLTQLTNQKHR